MYLKEFRVKLDMTQKQFSELLGIAQNAIARYENNKVTPTINVIEQYINKLNANPNYLFLGIEPHLLNDTPKLNNDVINLLNELSILTSEEELKEKLNKILLDKIMEKFQYTSSSILIKFLTVFGIQGPDRPLLFMYYIAQIIENKFKSVNLNIVTYKDFLSSVINDFPVWKIFFNQPIFTEQIKKEFIQIIEYKLNENDCKLIVQNYKNILEILEEKMPSSVIFMHKNKFK
jgi:transcriptional regulator with XRE-family HTH domain